jgi:hypothetical protein
MPRKQGPGSAGPVVLVYLGDGVLQNAPSKREIERLARDHGLQVEELRTLLNNVQVDWAFGEHRWQEAHDPAVRAFQKRAIHMLSAWEALARPSQNNADAYVAAELELRVARGRLGRILERLPGALGDPSLWRRVATGKRGLPPHTRKAIEKLEDFWRQTKGGPIRPAWSEEQNKAEPGPGARFAIEILKVTTGVTLTPQQLRDAWSSKGRLRTGKARRSSC